MTTKARILKFGTPVGGQGDDNQAVITMVVFSALQCFKFFVANSGEHMKKMVKCSMTRIGPKLQSMRNLEDKNDCKQGNGIVNVGG